MKIRFGKYKGVELKEIPCSYLNWILINLKEVSNKDLFIEIRKLLNIKE